MAQVSQCVSGEKEEWTHMHVEHPPGETKLGSVCRVAEHPRWGRGHEWSTRVEGRVE